MPYLCRMKICIIGSGRVACQLASGLHSKKNLILSIAARPGKALQEMEAFAQTCALPEIPDADLYLIAVKDDAIAAVAELLKEKSGLVAHTSGSVPIEALRACPRKAVFYPMQTFSKERKADWKKIPVFLETENPEDTLLLEKTVQALGAVLRFADSEQRKKIHLCAVFACNFSNYMWTVAEDLSSKYGLCFEDFRPLIEETFSKMKKIGPAESQTGPARRGDQSVTALQENLLSDTPYQELYRTITNSIAEFYHCEKEKTPSHNN